MIQNIVYHGDGESITQIGSQAIVGRDLSEKLNSTGRSAEQTHVVLILQCRDSL